MNAYHCIQTHLSQNDHNVKKPASTLLNLTFRSFWFSGDQPGADLGPVISPEAKERVCDLVQSGVDEGASVSDNDYVCYVQVYVHYSKL